VLSVDDSDDGEGKAVVMAELAWGRGGASLHFSHNMTFPTLSLSSEPTTSFVKMCSFIIFYYRTTLRDSVVELSH